MLTESELLRIYREQMGPLYANVSRRVGGDRTLAEDIVQDVWLRAVATWPRRGVPDQPQAWLARVSRNLIASHFRRRRPEPVTPERLGLLAGGTWPETESTAALLGWGLSRIRRHHAEVLEAFYFEGRTTREIAQTRGLSERAVEGRLRRARQSLARRLRPYIEADGLPGNVSGGAEASDPVGGIA